MQTQQTTLNNGLRIVTCSRPNTETVSLGIWIKTGSAYEDEKINGISHFLEHMVFKGTKNRTSLQISEEIENVGGQNNAYTSREFTAFYAKMLKDDTELALDVISDLILNPTFPEEELVKEREVVVQDRHLDILGRQSRLLPQLPAHQAHLGKGDHLNSSGMRLKSVGEILRQDRANYYGGRSFFIPQCKSFIREFRDREIVKRLASEAAVELAREFGVSEVQIYRIAKKQRNLQANVRSVA